MACDIGDKVKIQLTYDPSIKMPPMPEPFRHALRGNPDLQKAWRLRPSAKRREILDFLTNKKSNAELAPGVAEVIKLLLKKR